MWCKNIFVFILNVPVLPWRLKPDFHCNKKHLNLVLGNSFDFVNFCFRKHIKTCFSAVYRFSGRIHPHNQYDLSANPFKYHVWLNRKRHPVQNSLEDRDASRCVWSLSREPSGRCAVSREISCYFPRPIPSHPLHKNWQFAGARLFQNHIAVK